LPISAPRRRLLESDDMEDIDAWRAGSRCLKIVDEQRIPHPVGLFTLADGYAEILARPSGPGVPGS
jgi:hypothetical protein